MTQVDKAGFFKKLSQKMAGVRDFYKNRNVLISGGTGFMGKVLVEKMLTSIPDIGKIYILIRPKKGLTPQERVAAMLSNKPFTFNHINENQFPKVIALQADMGEENLALNEKDKQTIIDEVSVVIHFAASVRFDLPLKEAMKQNVISTLNVLNLCREITNLVSVVHLSTAFCNIDVERMEEKVYDLQDCDPYKVIDLVKWMDDDLLKQNEKSLIKPHPNTYTFTKRLAEIVAKDMGQYLPITIARPSIVVPAYESPAPGWVDNLNGPTGILIAAGKGVLRILYADVDTYPQLVPVDVAINGVLAMSWLRTVKTFSEPPVYNMTQGELYKISWREITDKARILAIKYPYKRFLWYPSAFATTNQLLFRVLSFLLHTMPAYFIDFLMVIFLQKTFLVDIQKRLNMGLELISYFAMKNFVFVNDKANHLVTELPEEEQDIFYLTNKTYDIDKYITNCFMGSRKYCLKNEEIDDSLMPKILLKICYIIDISFRFALVYFGLYFLLGLFGMNEMLILSY